MNNKSSELARGEKSYKRIICKEFFTLPQVSFVKNVFKLSRDFFNLKYFLPFSPLPRPRHLQTKIEGMGTGVIGLKKTRWTCERRNNITEEGIMLLEGGN